MADCKRCEREFDEKRGALSRTDNETHICPDCGYDEAIEQGQGQLTEQVLWPILGKVWAAVVDPNGEVQVDLIEPSGVNVHDLIGDYFEAHNLIEHEAHVYIDERGRLKGLDPNPIVSVLTGKSIVGRGVIFGSSRTPDEASIPPSLWKALVGGGPHG